MKPFATAAAAVVVLLALAGCSVAKTPAESESTWVLPFQSSEGGCSGTATMRGSSQWAIVSDRLVSGQNIELAAFCDARSRYLAHHPDLAWDIRSMVEIVFPDGMCASATDVTISGQPGLLCEYDHNETHWLQLMTIVGDKWVTLQGAIKTAGTAAEADARRMLNSVVLEIH